MKIAAITFGSKSNYGKKYTIDDMGKGVELPTADRNYTQYNLPLVKYYVQRGAKALPEMMAFLKSDDKKSEEALTQALYIIDRMIDNNVRGFNSNLYPALCKYNNSESPNVQTLLAGIYRKTQPVEAFGPLCSMLIQNSVRVANGTSPKPFETKTGYFDPNEEIGGAIFEYLKRMGASSLYQDGRDPSRASGDPLDQKLIAALTNPKSQIFYTKRPVQSEFDLDMRKEATVATSRG